MCNIIVVAFLWAKFLYDHQSPMSAATTLQCVLDTKPLLAKKENYITHIEVKEDAHPKVRLLFVLSDEYVYKVCWDLFSHEKR